MKYSPVIEYNGKKYMSAKTAADVWGLRPATVADYCCKGKIYGAIKYFEARWYIPVDAVKPLSNDEIRRFLILTLQLKNKPSLEIDWSTFPGDYLSVELIYRHLVYCGMLENFDIKDKKRIPYEVILTQKGLEIATSGNRAKNVDFGTVLKDWLPTIISAAQLITQVAQMTAA